ncbi:MAG: 1-phosphofructokinase family hexose kinase [Salinibacterium amurskyense]
MITTVTPNPAIDITYTVNSIRRGESNRVQSVADRAGGKGLNVARVLHRCGAATAVTGLFGGDSGRWILNELFTAGIAVEPTLISESSRRTVTVVEDAKSHSATVLNERGPTTTLAEWNALYENVATLLHRSTVLVVSGSIPPGSEPDALSPLIVAARDAGVPCIVDTTGPTLLASARAGATLLKPNIDELREAFDVDIRTHDGIVTTARKLVALGARGVVVSLGAEGMLGVDNEHVYWCPAIAGVSGNPTGAGDAAVAGLAQALADKGDWTMLLRNAVSFGAAAVLAPEAGDVAPDAIERFLQAAHPTALTPS